MHSVAFDHVIVFSIQQESSSLLVEALHQHYSQARNMIFGPARDGFSRQRETMAFYLTGHLMSLVGPFWTGVGSSIVKDEGSATGVLQYVKASNVGNGNETSGRAIPWVQPVLQSTTFFDNVAKRGVLGRMINFNILRWDTNFYSSIVDR